MSAASLAAVPARRLNRRALRTLGGVLIAAGALVANVWFWGQDQRADPVLVVGRELPAGHRLTADDLGRREMRLAPETRALAVPAARLADVLDRPVAQPLRSGTLLTADRLAAEPAAEGRAIIAVGLRPELTPPLAPGNRVDVVALGAVPGASSAAGAREADRAVLARGAIVRSVSFPASGLAGAGLGGAGSAAGRTDRAPSGAVLLVEPAVEGAILAAAAGAGVALALMPPGDGAGAAPTPGPATAPVPAATGGRP